MNANERAQYKQAFDFFDSDSSGQISTQELGKAMQQLGYNLNEQQIKQILTHVDNDGSGQIGFEEFLAFVQSAKSQ